MGRARRTLHVAGRPPVPPPPGVAREAWLAALRGVLGALALAACGPATPAAAPAGSPEALAAYLETVATADAATRLREIASWQLDAALWSRTVAPPYRPLHAAYQAGFAAAVPALVVRLGQGGPVTGRRHFAGDPRLTRAEARDRWALPVLAPSAVAEAGGAPIDAVFIADGERWRALVGLDAALRARVASLDPRCATYLALAGPAGRCTEVGAAIADAALRIDREQLAHVCRLAETLCGKGLP